MTDPIDELLRRAGAEFRAGEAPPPAPAFADRRPARRRAHPLLALVAACATVLAVAAGFNIVKDRAGQEHAGTADVAGTAAAPSAATTTSTTTSGIADGDLVEASGLVVARPGAPVEFCPVPLMAASTGFTPPDCGQFGITVTGVQIDQLSNRIDAAGVQAGSAKLVGEWSNGVLRVTKQLPFKEPAARQDRHVPCALPAGGWKRAGNVDRTVLEDYVETHRDQVRQLWLTYPDGHPQDPMDGDFANVVVLEVVAGDVAAVRRELTPQFPGNLCVAPLPGQPSIADQEALHQRVFPVLASASDDESLRIYSIGGPADRITLGVVMDTPELRASLSSIDLAGIEIEPWLRASP